MFKSVIFDWLRVLIWIQWFNEIILLLQEYTVIVFLISYFSLSLQMFKNLRFSFRIDVCFRCECFMRWTGNCNARPIRVFCQLCNMAEWPWLGALSLADRGQTRPANPSHDARNVLRTSLWGIDGRWPGAYPVPKLGRTVERTAMSSRGRVLRGPYSDTCR